MLPVFFEDEVVQRDPATHAAFGMLNDASSYTARGMPSGLKLKLREFLFLAADARNA